MPYLIKINQKEFSFEKSHKSIFHSAKKSDVYLDHSCLTAKCKNCKARLIEGEIRSIEKENVLNEIEKKNGYILTCNSIPLTNLILETSNLYDDQIKSKIIPAKIDDLNFITDNLLELRLRIPEQIKFNYIPGQYLNLTSKNITRSYSLTEAIIKNQKIRLFVKYYPKGLMSNYLFNNAKIDDVVRIEGPLGSFRIQNNQTKTVVFLATGTGIAPVKSILEYLDSNNQPDRSTVWLFWGNRYEEEFNWIPKMKSFKLNYIPVLSKANQSWKGKVGYIQDVMVNYISDLSETTVYACGSKKMIDDSFDLLQKKGLKENRFYSDAFLITK